MSASVDELIAGKATEVREHAGDQRVTHRACHLCEAICGLEIRTVGETIASIRGDAADPFSRGHICPKAVALMDVHDDPDRVRSPMQRVGGQFVPITWDHALTLVATRFAEVQRAHGANALGLYLGNPNAHHVGSLLHLPHLIRTLQTRNRFSATSVDQLPHHVVAQAMFGHMFLLPVPDLDRTAYWLVIGANPLVSNGSLMTAPDVAKRLKAIRARGGGVIVIDPVRTDTAEAASRHHFIRPGTDAAFLLALVNALLELGPPRVARYGDRIAGLDEALAAIRPFGVDASAAITGIAADDVRRIARELHDAPSAAVYGRIGVSTQAFGSVCQWLIQLVNVLLGMLDAEGGAMLPLPAVPLTGPGTRPGGFNKQTSRVSQRPIFHGELPAATLAEEIDTPGDGQIRAMLTIAGNPVSSTPNGRRLDRALAGLEFMAAIDIYVNETTRHADVILPPASMLAHDNYDVVFNALAIRNVARWNPPVFAKPGDAKLDWEIYAGLGAAYAQATGADYTRLPPPALMIDHALRNGPYGATLSIAALAAAPHGIDLGALQPSLLDRLETPDRRIQCAPPMFIGDLARVAATFTCASLPDDTLRLVGRRHLRSNNSWMHNAHRLVKGPRRDQLWMHPQDAAARAILGDTDVRLESRTGHVVVRVAITDRVMRGTVCLPHGFGQSRDGVALDIASALAGASYNDVSDDTALDALSGNAALSALPVHVRPSSTEPSE